MASGSRNESTSPDRQGTMLLRIARQSVEEQLGCGQLDRLQDEWLHERRASFVTIMAEDALRGCIGTIRPMRSLFDDVCSNAVAAATGDPRFPPVTVTELGRIRFEISLLSPLTRVDADDEEALMSRIQPGVDGVLFEWGHAVSTFLPQVWETLKEPRLFLRELRHKAGVSGDTWSAEMMWWTYRVHRWSETPSVRH